MLKRIILLLCAFCLKLNAQTILYTQSFQGAGSGIGAGITQTTFATDGGWIKGDSSTLSSNVVKFRSHTIFVATNDDDCNCNKSDDKLIFPAVNLNGQNIVYFSCDYAFAGLTNAGANESLLLSCSSDSGATWQNITFYPKSPFDAAVNYYSWASLSFDVSAYAANQSHFIFALTYSDGGQWNYAAAVDNVKLFVPPAYDFAAGYSATSKYVGVGDSIRLAFTNRGYSTVNSVQVNYSIDNGTANSCTLNGINTASLDTVVLTHLVSLAGLSSGPHAVKAWISSLDGNSDQDHSNDTLSFSVIACSQLTPRKVLCEDFTSATCGPSFFSNTVLNQLMFANNANSPMGTMSLVKYPVNFPSPGDPAYTADAAGQCSYYNTFSVSHAYLDGVYFDRITTYLTQPDLDSAGNIPSPLSISNINAYVDSVTVHVSGNIMSFANINCNAKIKVAIVENSYDNTTGGGGTNADTVWFDVMRKMLPNYKGIGIGNLSDGGNYPFNVSYSFNGYSGPGTGFPKIFSNISNLNAIVWVQDSLTREVYQSESSDVFTLVNEPESYFQTFDLYPNPTIGNFQIRFTLKEKKEVSVEIYNMLGECIQKSNMGKLYNDINYYNADLNSVSSGLYTVKVITDGQSISRKILKTE
jgi:hypothetical protein